MATYNRDREDQEHRNEDDPDVVVPIPVNNPAGGTNGPYVPFIPTVRPYEGLSDEMAEANDDLKHNAHVDYDDNPTDVRINREIDDHLTQHSYIDTNAVSVTVKDGKVTLEGSVPDADQKNYVEEVVMKIEGVKGVDNRLTVKKPQTTLTENPTGKQ